MSLHTYIKFNLSQQANMTEIEFDVGVEGH